MVHDCEACGGPAKSRCSGCTSPTAWYCSTACQRSYWVVHIFECNPEREITTADHLALAVRKKRLPSDWETCLDYGFERAFMMDIRSNLLELYIELMEGLKISPKKIHMWRINGTLVENIKAAFNNVPAGSLRRRSYNWFLQNQYVIDRSSSPPRGHPADGMLLRFWQYVRGPNSDTFEDIIAEMSTWPEKKKACREFCIYLLFDIRPGPDEEAFVTFGFCACQDDSGERAMASLYRRLLDKCTFDELCNAYDTSTLIHLIDSKGFRPERARYPCLEDVLAHSPRVFKSVWELKRHVFTKGRSETIPSVALDYGFINCKKETEMLELKDVYKQFFAHPHADPIKLHEAAIGGKLFEYIGGFVTLKKRFQRLMKNPYPLQPS